MTLSMECYIHVMIALEMQIIDDSDVYLGAIQSFECHSLIQLKQRLY